MPCFNQESPSGVRAPDLGAMSDHFTDHQVEEITLLLYSPMGLDLKLANRAPKTAQSWDKLALSGENFRCPGRLDLEDGGLLPGPA